MAEGNDLAAGARNLLLNCAQLRPGQRVLIVQEDPELGWYDREAPAAVQSEASMLGFETASFDVGAPDNEKRPDLNAALADYDATIFFARIGDQERFGDRHRGHTHVVSYARTRQALASTFGRIDHRALFDLKLAIDDVLLTADKIEITCPLGTSLTGAAPATARAFRDDVTIKRFPLGVAQPVVASGFSGTVALAHYLTPSGSRSYQPPHLALDDVVLAEVVDGRIVGFNGDPAMVSKVRNHYRTVAGQFDIEGEVVHSWHAGFHPGCEYWDDASLNPDRWSNTIFNCPRFLHFHTCGNYAPGEICWMVLDPTVMADGKSLWEGGLFKIEHFEQTRHCAERWPDLKGVYDSPVQRIGINQ